MRTFEGSSEDYHWLEGTLWHKGPKILSNPSSSDFLLLEWRSSAYRTLARNVSSHRYLPVLDHPSSQNWASCSLWLCKFNYISVFWRVWKDDHQYSSIAQKGSLLGLTIFCVKTYLPVLFIFSLRSRVFDLDDSLYESRSDFSHHPNSLTIFLHFRILISRIDRHDELDTS